MKHFYITFLFILSLLNSTSAGVITVINPKNIIGGMGQVLTINGTGFGADRLANYVSLMQESGNYLDPANSKLLKYKSWTNTMIEIEMPCAYSGLVKINLAGTDIFSTDTLKVKANLGYRSVNPLDYDFLNNTNNKGGYTWYMHTSYWNNPSIKSAIEDVFKEFRCSTGINYILATVPSGAQLVLNDYINLISPDSLFGAAGYADKLWSSCVFGGTTFYNSSTMDIRFSTKLDWYFGNGIVPAGKSKFRYVLMHELGHSLGLGHVNELGQTMFPSVTQLPSDNWNSRDNLTLEEKTAIGYFVNLSKTFTFNSCGIKPLGQVFNCNDVYGLTAGIVMQEQPTSINIFPNPGTGIYSLSEMADDIKIYTTTGREIIFDSENNTTFNISNEPNGLYIIKIYDHDKIYVHKIIKR